MSTAVFLHVEIKDRDGKWRFLQCNVHKDIRTTLRIGSEDEREYYTATTITRQGDVRDFLRDNFTDRGFPSDMSDALRDKLSNNDGKFKTSFAEDARWGKSWCTLNEMANAAEKMREEWENEIRDEVRKREIDKVMDELREIKGLIKGEEYSPDTDTYDEDSLNFLLGESTFDFTSLEIFIGSVLNLCEFITGMWLLNDTEIRLVYYFL